MKNDKSEDNSAPEVQLEYKIVQGGEQAWRQLFETKPKKITEELRR